MTWLVAVLSFFLLVSFILFIIGNARASAYEIENKKLKQELQNYKSQIVAIQGQLRSQLRNETKSGSTVKEKVSRKKKVEKRKEKMTKYDFISQK